MFTLEVLGVAAAWLGLVVTVLLDGRRTREKVGERLARLETQQVDGDRRTDRLERRQDAHEARPHPAR